VRLGGGIGAAARGGGTAPAAGAGGKRGGGAIPVGAGGSGGALVARAGDAGAGIGGGEIDALFSRGNGGSGGLVALRASPGSSDPPALRPRGAGGGTPGCVFSRLVSARTSPRGVDDAEASVVAALSGAGVPGSVGRPDWEAIAQTLPSRGASPQPASPQVTRPP
jgi:hypothetical protein